MGDNQTHDWVDMVQVWTTLLKERDSYIDRFKSGAEYFTAGRIAPTRLMKTSPKRYRHHTVFGLDCWALYRNKSYFVYADLKNDGGFIDTLKPRSWHFDISSAPFKVQESIKLQCAPYGLHMNLIHTDSFMSELLYKFIAIFGWSDIVVSDEMKLWIKNVKTFYSDLGKNPPPYTKEIKNKSPQQKRIAEHESPT